MFKVGDYWIHKYSLKNGRMMRHIRKITTQEEADGLNRANGEKDESSNNGK